MTTVRCAATMLQHTLDSWRAQGDDLWLFAYGSLIWKTEFEVAEKRPARVLGHHRALQMWSRVNRGTPERPGLVLALINGGSCRGMALRVKADQVPAMLPQLWHREMPNPVYDPKWLPCQTPQGTVKALSFTLSRHSPNFTGRLSDARLREIFAHSRGRYGSTLEYARLTCEHLRAIGIHDAELERVVALAHDTPSIPHPT
ncbi:gamma-glutamylcyclotransferase [Hydrogenophaga sp. OTU3427]|uniref:gamma-glutamylcyclotransferase n=1 Tax=Hydrogenophaga sp. OTU3427 TaxID=3043856 RepID=UPI00313E04C0